MFDCSTVPNTEMFDCSTVPSKKRLIVALFLALKCLFVALFLALKGFILAASSWTLHMTTLTLSISPTEQAYLRFSTRKSLLLRLLTA